MGLPFFALIILLLGPMLGAGHQIAAGHLNWTLNGHRISMLIIAFVPAMFFYFQAVKLFWRLLAEIQAGTIEQVYLSPLPSWLVAAAGRLTAAIIETLVLMGVAYGIVSAFVTLHFHWTFAALVPLTFLIVTGVGYSLIIAGMTLLWKRIQILQDTILMLVQIFAVTALPLITVPGWFTGLSRVFPVTADVASLYGVMLGHRGVTALWGTGGLVWVAVTAAAYLAAGLVVFRVLERITKGPRRPGRLLTDRERTHTMTSIEHDNDASPAGFTAECGTSITDERVTVGLAVIGLTNFGERPVPSTRLAEVLGRPVSEAEALARQWGWPGTRVEDGLITVNPERAKSATRRHVQIGDRRFGVTGCGCDIFFYAPLVRPSLHLEETCTVTRTPIRLVFTPGRVEHVEPAGAVMAMMGPPERTNAVEAAGDVDIEDIDADVCGQSPLFASAEAARGWLAAHPCGRVFPVRQAWDLSFHQRWRDRMSALLNLGN